MLCSDNTPTLSADLLLAAYVQGLFPMADHDGAVHWYTADPRAVFPLESIRPNARFRRFLRSAGFRYTLDEAFEEVIGQCASLHGDSWISPELEEVYIALHRAGHAHSVETWAGDELVGGIYGVHLGSAFFGESMFSTRPNGSKAAFHFLAEHLRQRGFTLFDSQFINDHTASLGAVEIPKAEYLVRLRKALEVEVRFL
jgi:leucyl/phenylalanyl-tRNA--protein transferase